MGGGVGGVDLKKWERKERLEVFRVVAVLGGGREALSCDTEAMRGRFCRPHPQPGQGTGHFQTHLEAKGLGSPPAAQRPPPPTPRMDGLG